MPYNSKDFINITQFKPLLKSANKNNSKAIKINDRIYVNDVIIN